MPSIDVIETGQAIKIKADMAGMKPEDVNLEVEDNVLTLSGERRFEEQVEEGKYYRIERRYGSFSRSIALPQGVDADAIEAHFEQRRARGRRAQGRDGPAEEDRGLGEARAIPSAVEGEANAAVSRSRRPSPGGGGRRPAP